MLCARLVVLTLMAAFVFAAPASAAPGVVQDLPGCRTATLPANDDDSTVAVPLGFTANMFDRSFGSVFVNNNGNVTVAESLSEFTPFDFRETGDPIIAPFFADVDTTGDASGLVHYGQIANFLGSGNKAFCVIWDHVGYFGSHDDKLNTFQLIIVDRGALGIDLIANYDTITWETGDASEGENGFGGTSAVAGYAAGDGDSGHALIAPGSFVNGGLLDANPATSLAGHSTAGQPAGRYLFELRQSPPTGARLTGIVTTPDDDPAAGALVQACRTGGTCVSRTAGSDGRYTASNLPAGTYTVTAFPGPGPGYGSTTVPGVVLSGIGTVTEEDIELGPLPDPPPDGTTITSIGESEDGLPVAYWGDPLTLITQGCTGGTAAYQLVLEGRNVRSGALTESPAGSGTFRATIAPLAPDHGDGTITITFTCPGGTSEPPVEFGIYIDPSGVVRDKAGNPIEGATVRLFRSASASGPFFPVPNGSAIMSPANRVNPDESRADGRFGWDVVAGFYVVTAAKDGCVSAADPTQETARTAVLTIPPPVTDLDIRLDCPDPPPVDPGSGDGGTTTPPVVTPPTSSPGPAVPAAAPRRLASVGKVALLKGKVLVVPVSCARTARTACSGAITAKLGRKVIAKKAYKGLKAGAKKSVRLTLSKAGRKLVAKIKRGKKFKIAVTVTVKDAAGKGATAKRTVSVRR